MGRIPHRRQPPFREGRLWTSGHAGLEKPCRFGIERDRYASRNFERGLEARSLPGARAREHPQEGGETKKVEGNAAARTQAGSQKQFAGMDGPGIGKSRSPFARSRTYPFARLVPAGESSRQTLESGGNAGQTGRQAKHTSRPHVFAVGGDAGGRERQKRRGRNQGSGDDIAHRLSLRGTPRPVCCSCDPERGVRLLGGWRGPFQALPRQSLRL